MRHTWYAAAVALRPTTCKMTLMANTANVANTRKFTWSGKAGRPYTVEAEMNT